jgi:hypothetical protein
MRLELSFLNLSFVDLVMLPLKDGSHARGEEGASCMASAGLLLTKLCLFTCLRILIYHFLHAIFFHFLPFSPRGRI